jgi:hypothetical protein
MTMSAPGTCRHCKCTEDNACRLSEGDNCCWINRDRNVCSRPACIKAEEARLARIPKPRKRTTADIHELIRRGNRRPKKRRAA